MKQFIVLFLFCPLLAAAQSNHRFQNDTLYTSCGFKIYKGQTLQFGKSHDWIGFRYITIKNGISPASLENNSVVVKDVSKYGKTITGSPTIDVKGSIVYQDGSKGTISLNIIFDLAIGKRVPGLQAELIVPEEFRISKEKALAQNLPALDGDTLFTSSGYRIYKGQVIQFGKTTGRRGNFRYVNVRNSITDHSLEERQLRVKELKEFGFSVLDNGYITIIGTLIIKDKDREDVEVHMAFDHAIENIPGVPSELVVPDEYRNKLKLYAPREVDRIEDLYRNKIISKEEFETIKKKLLEN